MLRCVFISKSFLLTIPSTTYLKLYLGIFNVGPDSEGQFHRLVFDCCGFNISRLPVTLSANGEEYLYVCHLRPKSLQCSSSDRTLLIESSLGGTMIDTERTPGN